MGGSCCVAAKDKTIIHQSNSEVLNRNNRYSPTWSFRWDNRGRVAGEDTSIHWFRDGIGRNDGSQSEIKVESSCASQDGSQFGSSQRCTWQKSPGSEGTAAHLRTPASDRSISMNVSMDTSLDCVEVKDSTESPEPSNSSSQKLSVPLSSTSSFSTVHLSSQCHTPLAEITKLRSNIPQNQPTKRAFERFPGLKSSYSLSTAEERPAMPSWSNHMTPGYHRGSSDDWSLHAFPEMMFSSPKDSWSLDNEVLAFQHDKTHSSSRIQAPPTVDVQTCRVCLKLLTERSLWSSKKLVFNNELSVVAVLTCGHVYHAECLETLTPEIDKYDPACPICTFGEKQTLKLSKKALKAEMASKARNRKLKKRIVDSDPDGNSFIFDRLKTHGYEGKGPKMASSSSMKMAMPFLKRHFSFGSKGSRSLIENRSTRDRRFFWTKSMKA